jgi:hypothetical protein
MRGWKHRRDDITLLDLHLRLFLNRILPQHVDEGPLLPNLTPSGPNLTPAKDSTHVTTMERRAVTPPVATQCSAATRLIQTDYTYTVPYTEGTPFVDA